MKKSDLIQVKEIFRKKLASLIEVIEEGYPVRVSVTSSDLVVAKDGTLWVSRDVFEEGLSYGVPWKYKLTVPQVTPEQIEKELHKAGIWTAEDAMSNTAVVQNALMSAFRMNLSEILRISKEDLRKEK